MTFVQISRSFKLCGGIFVFAVANAALVKDADMSRHLYCFCKIILSFLLCRMLCFLICRCCYCNTWQWQISARISSETTHATALKLGRSIVDISTRFYFASLAALDSPLGHHGPPKSKMGPLSSFTSICIPEASLNRRAPKLGRNVHLHRLSEISNVFFRTPRHARAASRNAKTRFGLSFGNYLT